jgi:hypothetical protein
MKPQYTDIQTHRTTPARYARVYGTIIFIGSRDPINDPISGLLSGPLNELQLSDIEIDTAAGILFGLLNGPLSGPLKDVLNSNDIDVIHLLMKNTYNTAQIAEQLQKPVTTVKKYVGKLTKMHCIEYQGAKKTGGYVLTTPYIEQLRKTKR